VATLVAEAPIEQKMVVLPE